MHICMRTRWLRLRSKVKSANKFSQISVNIWAINAKHRRRKLRANTLFVIGRNIDGSMIDLRRFYLIISRPDRESSLIKDPSKVKDSYLLSLKFKENGIPKNMKKMSLLNIRSNENSNKVWTTLRLIFNSLWDCERVIIVCEGVPSEDIGAKSSYERSPAGWKSDSDIFLKRHIVTNMW